MAWLVDVLRRFRRELRGFVVMLAIVWVVVMVLGFVIDPEFDPVVMGLSLAFLFVALLPVVWLRYGDQPIVRSAHHRVRRTFGVIGLGCLWTALILILFAGVLAWLGLD